MRILFDQGTPAPLRRHLSGHTVDTLFKLGWSELENGEPLTAAERAGFEVLVTTDQNMRYQQNLKGRVIAIVVLSTTSLTAQPANQADGRPAYTYYNGGVGDCKGKRSAALSIYVER